MTEPDPRCWAIPSGRRERILLVDDDAEVRATTRRVLESGGYVGLEAAGGPDALERLESRTRGLRPVRRRADGL